MFHVMHCNSIKPSDICITKNNSCNRSFKCGRNYCAVNKKVCEKVYTLAKIDKQLLDSMISQCTSFSFMSVCQKSQFCTYEFPRNQIPSNN